MPYKDKEERRAHRRRWYLAHREEVIVRSAQWRKDNPKKYRKWVRKNRLKHNAEVRAWYAENKQHVVDYVKQWRKDNPEKTVAQRKRYKKKHKREIAVKSAAYRAVNYERDKKRAEKRRRDLKIEVFVAYGSKCACLGCGESNFGFLTIDHVQNDGKEHRKKVQAGYAFHRWLKKNDFPKKRFRLLCWNCNVGRYYNGGVCPHLDGR